MQELPSHHGRESDTTLPHLDILEIVNELIRVEKGPAGFRGTICLVVGDLTGVRVWAGRFGRTTGCGFVEQIPADADVVWGVGSAEAASLLGLRSMPESPKLLVSGDQALLARFFKRFFEHQNLLSLRAGCPG